MALEIKEIIIRALAGADKGSKSPRMGAGYDDDEDGCEEDKDTRKKQETMDAVSDMLKNEKER